MVKNVLPQVSLVLGGVNSGKSALAERLALAPAGRAIYLATAQAYDAEMTSKIAVHQARRGAGWTTVEVPFDAAGVLRNAAPDTPILMDCATLWLTNHLLADHDIAPLQTALIEAALDCASPVIIVSNEVGLGGVSDNALARRFAKAQGTLNQAVAARADLVVTVMAGLPLTLKGALPDA